MWWLWLVVDNDVPLSDASTGQKIRMYTCPESAFDRGLKVSINIMMILFHSVKERSEKGRGWKKEVAQKDLIYLFHWSWTSSASALQLTNSHKCLSKMRRSITLFPISDRESCGRSPDEEPDADRARTSSCSCHPVPELPRPGDRATRVCEGQLSSGTFVAHNSAVAKWYSKITVLSFMPHFSCWSHTTKHLWERQDEEQQFIFPVTDLVITLIVAFLVIFPNYKILLIRGFLAYLFIFCSTKVLNTIVDFHISITATSIHLEWALLTTPIFVKTRIPHAHFSCCTLYKSFCEDWPRTATTQDQK